MTDLQSKPSFDKLRLYFGEPYTVHTPNDKDIIIYQPTIGDIIEFGEEEFYAMVNVFIANSTMYRLQLWKNGVDWNKVSDYELFCNFCPSLPVEATKLLFGDIDFRLFEQYNKQLQDREEGVITLYNKEQDLEIDEVTYIKISEYIKFMFNIYPKVEKAKGKTTKEWIIEEDQKKYDKNKDKPFESNLLPLISSCVNHAGFKYKKNELREVGIVEFMDSVQRLQIYESTTALLRGSYSGFCDTSKVPKEQFNFMREIEYGRKPLNPNAPKPKKESKQEKTKP